MTPLIASSSHWVLLATVVGVAAMCIRLEQTRAWAARLSGPVLALVIGMLLSNTRLLPADAPAYDVLETYLVPAAIPLLLVRANLGRILKETGSMFRAFHVAAIGSFLGALLAGWIFKGNVVQIAEACGIMAASYIGGGVNFVAVQKSYGMGGELANPLMVADNFVMAAAFTALLSLSGSKWILARFQHPHTGETKQSDPQVLAAMHWRPKALSLAQMAGGLAFAFVVTAISMETTRLIKATFLNPIVQAIFANAYLMITVLSVALATLRSKWFEKLDGLEDLGMLFLYFFFVLIGLHADLLAVARQIPVLFALCLVITFSNISFTLVIGRIFRMPIEELLLACNATLGGAPTAAAMAISKGWSKLVLPGLLAGIWGYVIGTFVGIVVVELLRRIL